MTVNEFYLAMLALIDERMNTTDQERGKELDALVSACVAFEEIMFPMDKVAATQ